jgi:3'(2'), 5'-bisphosphate nucleotidase
VETPVTIRARSWPQTRPLAMLSRSHLDLATQALLARIPGIVSEPCGSALKFCRLAEGAADFYPRLAPTREWDVGAGHALLAAAGGAVLMPDGKALAFGRAEANFLVPAFMALGDVRAASRLMIEA